MLLEQLVDPVGRWVVFAVLCLLVVPFAIRHYHSQERGASPRQLALAGIALFLFALPAMLWGPLVLLAESVELVEYVIAG